MCQVEVAVCEQSMSLVRREVMQWLVSEGWPHDAAADIIWAVSEAVTNSVEHAYPVDVPDAPIEVQGEVECVDTDAAAQQQPVRRVRMRIRDRGRWRPDPHDRVGGVRYSGWGLQVIERVMAELVITTSAATGTLVELVSRAVPCRPTPACSN